MPDLKPRRLTFESKDGFVLQGEWHPTETMERSQVAVISPGMGIPARFYRPFARHFVKRGFDVLLFDFRGIGWSAVADLSHLQADASSCGKLDLSAGIDQAVALSGGKTVIGIGHSFGGSIFGLTDNVRLLDSMVHISSQSGYYGFYNLQTKLYMLLNIHIAMPLLTRWLGYYPAHWISGSEALPAGFVKEWSAWCLCENYYMDERFDIKGSSYHADYRGPLLSLSFADDSFATRESVDAMAAFYCNSRLERRHLNPTDFEANSFGHFNFFKPTSGRRAWDMIVDWIDTTETTAPGKRIAAKM